MRVDPKPDSVIASRLYASAADILLLQPSLRFCNFFSISALLIFIIDRPLCSPQELLPASIVSSLGPQSENVSLASGGAS
eukprot:6203079-Pleurochrysis_carterae.AAC.4